MITHPAHTSPPFLHPLGTVITVFVATTAPPPSATKVRVCFGMMAARVHELVCARLPRFLNPLPPTHAHTHTLFTHIHKRTFLPCR